MRVTIKIESDLNGEDEGTVELVKNGCMGERDDLRDFLDTVINSWCELQKEGTK